MWDRTKELDSVVKLMSFSHLFEEELFWPIATNDEVDEGIFVTEDWDDPSVRQRKTIGEAYFAARSIPFRYTRRLSITILTVFTGSLWEGSGVNFVGSTALGIVETIEG
jgi:hypothetical protein